MIRPGALRYEVTFQRRSTVRDSAGEPGQTWTNVLTRRAALERTPGAEVRAAAQRNERVPVVFRLRYVSGVDAHMRLVFDGRVHNVVSAVDPDGLKHELVVTAVELAGEVA